MNSLLVKLSISTFGNHRTDDEITNEVIESKHISEDSGSWRRVKLPPGCLDAINQFTRSVVKQYHKSMTAPWDEGVRLINGNVREAYESKMNEFKEQHAALVEAFGQRYQHPYTVIEHGKSKTMPSLVDQAKAMHNGAFDPKDYPVWSEMRSRFAVRFNFLPVPEGSHFKGKLKDIYGDALNADTEQRVKEAMADTWWRLIEPVRQMSNRLEDALNGNKKSLVVSSLIESMNEMATQINALNFTEDSNLSKAAKEIADTIGKLTPKQLREELTRESALETANEIIKNYGSLGVRKFVSN